MNPTPPAAHTAAHAPSDPDRASLEAPTDLPPTWRSLMLEVSLGRAAILLEQPYAPAGREPHPLGRVVVQRLDDTIWEAHHTADAKFIERGMDRAVQWDAEEAERILGLRRQEHRRLTLLREENGHPPLDGPLPFDPTWRGLLVEVGSGTGRLLISEPTEEDPRNPLARVVVERADGRVWEARSDEPRDRPGVRWTDWEVNLLRRADAEIAERCARLEREVSGAFDRARARHALAPATLAAELTGGAS